ncbi:MAG TPA: bifunctional riboflavin kinase/FAD synthetase [Bacteroidia bacterium]
MKVCNDINNLGKVPNPVVTTGTFDGVHLGHQRIIKRIREIAKKEKGETVLVTFYPHPRMVLFPDDNELRLLNTQEEKTALLEKFGIDNLVIIPFTKQFSRLSSVEFVRDIIVNRIGTKKLVIGYNHHFGRNREGSFEHLKEYGPMYGFTVEEIPAIDVDQVEVSSTKIRKALGEGDIRTANTYLGYEYMLHGTVVHGKKLGREIGYPTANISVDDKYKLVPADGIYAVSVEVRGKTHKGMMSIGMNPTVNGKGRTIEVNILDFNEEIYGERIGIGFRDWIREEKKFSDLEELKVQLGRDREATLQRF